MKCDLFKFLLLTVLALSISCLASSTKKRFDTGFGAGPATDAAPSVSIDSSSTTNVNEAVMTVGVPMQRPATNAGRGSAYAKSASMQKDLRERLSLKISEIHDGNVRVVGVFLLLCLLYGLVHALGPGHGKSIVVGYFLSRRGNVLQGVGLGASITVAHTLSAVLLLFVLYAVLKSTVFPAFEVGREGIEKCSYVLVMVTGILLVAIAVKDFVSCRRRKMETLEIPEVRKSSFREIVGVALVTGLVPCPAVALIVLFCLLNSMVLLSLAASLAICVGMTLTNVSFGIMAVLLRKGIDKGANTIAGKAWIVHVAVSLVGGLVVFASGLLLFCNMFSLQ